VVHAPPEKPVSFDWPDALRAMAAWWAGVASRLAAGRDEREPPTGWCSAP